MKYYLIGASFIYVLLIQAVILGDSLSFVDVNTGEIFFALLAGWLLFLVFALVLLVAFLLLLIALAYIAIFIKDNFG